MIHSRQVPRYKNGFTLIELLMALVVTGIVLAAVATLAFAMGTADDTSSNTSQKQAQVRYATVRISELIRHSKLICCSTSEDLAIWRADDNSDGQVSIDELVYIERGPDRDRLRLCDFSSSDGSPISLGSIQALSTDWWSPYSSGINYTALIPECSSVEFVFDVLPPQSRFVSISFALLENDVSHQYQISAGLRGWAGNLLNQSGDSLVSDDD